MKAHKEKQIPSENKKDTEESETIPIASEQKKKSKVGYLGIVVSSRLYSNELPPRRRMKMWRIVGNSLFE